MEQVSHSPTTSLEETWSRWATPGPQDTDTTNWDALRKIHSNEEWRDVASRKNTQYLQGSALLSVFRRPYGKDDAVWSAPRVLLSLDGGGIRGLSTVMILSELVKHIRVVERTTWPPAKTSGDSPLLDPDWVQNEMRHRSKLEAAEDAFPRVNRKDPDDEDGLFLLCHYFDYIAGTSTAGLIATMLGRMRMPIGRTQLEFRDLTKEVYGVRYRSRVRRVRYMLMPHKSIEDGRVKDVIGSVFGVKARFHSDTGRCKTIVCSFERGTGNSVKIPLLFRSYDDDERDSKLSLTDVMRATACSPYYFSAVTLGNKKIYDTGLRWTNPTVEVCREVRDRDRSKVTHTFALSIGCGYKTGVQKSFPATRLWHLDSNKDRLLRTSEEINQSLALGSEDVHARMENSQDPNLTYYRLNATFHLEEVNERDISSWEDEVKYLQKSIEMETERYLRTEDVQKKLKLVAEKLVDIRRQRSRTTGWEAFAFGSQ